MSLIAVLSSFQSYTQTEDLDTLKIIPEVENSLIEWTEEEPEFPGGDEAMMKFIKDSLIYPEEAQAKKEEGMVYIQFKIDAEGYLGNFIVLQGVSESLDEEALRVVSSFPKKWNPYMFAGEYKESTFIVPIRFVLDREE